MLIAFFTGVDGAGKSTLAKLLAYHIYGGKKNIKVVYVWMRWSAYFSYPILLICRLLGYTRWRQGFSAPIREYHRNRAIAKLWSVLFLLDYAVYVKIKLLSIRADYVIIDRFMPDILIDVLYDTRLNVLDTLIGKFFLSLMFKYSRKYIGILVDVDQGTALTRRSDVPSSDYVRFRIPLYGKIQRMMGLTRVDGCKPACENIKHLLRVLGHVQSP